MFEACCIFCLSGRCAGNGWNATEAHELAEAQRTYKTCKATSRSVG
jgi:hypothetical protein